MSSGGESINRDLRKNNYLLAKATAWVEAPVAASPEKKGSPDAGFLQRGSGGAGLVAPGPCQGNTNARPAPVALGELRRAAFGRAVLKPRVTDISRATKFRHGATKFRRRGTKFRRRGHEI